MHVYLSKEDNQQIGFSNLHMKRLFCKDQVLSSSLHSKGFDVNEEINNEMDGTPKVEFDGYNYDSSNDATSESNFLLLIL